MKIWRVQVAPNQRLRQYDRGSKTYKQYDAAIWAYENFKQRGIVATLFEAEVEPPQWYELTID